MPTDKKPLADALPWNGKLPESYVGEEFNWDGGRFLLVRRAGGAGAAETARVCQNPYGTPMWFLTRSLVTRSARSAFVRSPGTPS